MRSSTDTLVNEWDLLAERFNTYKRSYGEIHPDAAVNIYLGWPVFFEQIQSQIDYLGENKLTIMDFGCGVGAFCKRLEEKGHEVIGTDKSEAMLSIAKEHSPDGISYCFSNECDVYKGKVDVITSMHVLDWVENSEDTLKWLSEFLKPKGLLLFSVFPKKHVIESLEIKDLFEDFDSTENPTKGFCNFDGVRVPVFVHEAGYYDNIFEKLHLEKVLEYYPPFPKVFFEKYQWSGARYPEMMILAYRKN